MNTYMSMVLGLVLAATGSLVHAQIYQSEDAEGNPVFSDTATEGSKKVKLPEANIADAVEESPVEPAQPSTAGDKAPEPESTWQAPDPDAGPDIVIIGDQSVPIKRQDSGDNPRHEVPRAEPRAQQGDAVPRRERGD